jgi:hypothetical protein
MQISTLIVDQLAGGEKRILGLVVAVRKSLGRGGMVKGDLSQMVKSALRRLIASEAVVEVDGVYSLAK